MGTASSTSIKNYSARIETKDEKTFMLSYHAFVEHILLLRKVINHPEMRQEGPVLDSFIKDYLNRMVRGEMRTANQQLMLPWEIEWIWHVHRLHPLGYFNDCNRQLTDGLVDKKGIRLIFKDTKKDKSKTALLSIDSFSTIDLRSAIIRQNVFLNKFRRHFLYSYDLKRLNKLMFQHFVQDYGSFIKLARRNQMIVPTFDIGLIWHTHMRFPSNYHEFSKGLCGFILDHDDSIETYILSDAYQITADRWKQTYHTEYAKHFDRKHLQTSGYASSCAAIADPFIIPKTTERPMHSTFQRSYEPSSGYTGATYGVRKWTDGYGGDCTLLSEQNFIDLGDISF